MLRLVAERAAKQVDLTSFSSAEHLEPPHVQSPPASSLTRNASTGDTATRGSKSGAATSWAGATSPRSCGSSSAARALAESLEVDVAEVELAVLLVDAHLVCEGEAAGDHADDDRVALVRGGGDERERLHVPIGSQRGADDVVRR